MIIVITRPDFFADEAMVINRMFSAGLQRLHIRKPAANANEVRRLIELIGEKYYSKIVLHDHHHLAAEYGLGGIHLNSRNPKPFSGWSGLLGRSCHSLDELCDETVRCDYRFLSPVFDSISKSGYNSAFSMQQLEAACDAGIINRSVYALGGVSRARLPQIKALGFGGAALLGEPWNVPFDGDEIEKYIRSLNDWFCIRSLSDEDYPRMSEIWESAVVNTHHFLKKDDFNFYKERLPLYFQYVSLVGFEADGVTVGFAGVAENNLEMLFIDNEYRGSGIGKALIEYAIKVMGVKKVDVNEDNSLAVGFYRRMGFHECGRSDTDSEGKNYPILHMEL